jgi:hypothetical protein
MHPDVLAAMADAARGFVVLDELRRGRGRIAELTGMPAGTSPAAPPPRWSLPPRPASLAATDRIRSCQSDGMPDGHHHAPAVITTRCSASAAASSKSALGQYRAGGMEQAINPQTAAVFYVDSRHTHPGV